MRHVVLLFVLIFTGCAGIPKTSLVDCKDRIGLLNKYAFECIESAETVILPASEKLANLPPAKVRPVVAVYRFGDLTGQRKSRE